jgi:hypothetical protein
MRHLRYSTVLDRFVSFLEDIRLARIKLSIDAFDDPVAITDKHNAFKGMYMRESGIGTAVELETNALTIWRRK